MTELQQEVQLPACSLMLCCGARILALLPLSHLTVWQLDMTKEQARTAEQRLQEQLQASMSSGGEAAKTAASLQSALGKAQDDSKKLQQQLQQSERSLSECSKEATSLRLQLQQLQAQLLLMQSQHASEIAARAAAAEAAAASASAEATAAMAKLQALQEELTRAGNRLDEAESSRYRTESKLRALEEEKSRTGANVLRSTRRV